MTPFPVSSSHLSASALAHFLPTRYALGAATECMVLRFGINDTYAVTDGTQRFVFRVYSLNWRTQEEIHEEIRLLQLLHERGIAVSHALPDKDGSYLQALQAPEGLRWGVLFTFAEGHKVHHYPGETHALIGSLMARLHVETLGLALDRIHYAPSAMVEEGMRQIARFLPGDAPEMQFMQATQSYLMAQFAKIDSSSLRHGAVHLDIWFDNLNITPAGAVTLFDFDFCGNGMLCLDIAYYVMQVHNVERDANACREKVAQFLAGYNSVTHISEEEMRLLPMLGVCLYFFYLGVQCQRFEDWSNSFLNESYLRRYIDGLVRRYFEAQVTHA